jgi:hypothetical protein
MQFLVREIRRLGAYTLAALLWTTNVHGQELEVTVRPNGSAASGRPLPIGAAPSVTIAVRNTGKNESGRVELTARLDGLVAQNSEVWRADGGALRAEIEPIPAEASAERTLRLRVEAAPQDAAAARISVEARQPDGKTASGSAEMKTADCAGAYRARLAAMRETLVNPVREAADELRKADPALPAARMFPFTGARSGELARAERLAATFTARRGADPQMSTEWFRFLIARWASELNAYAGQAANPGLCANNYYQIAGYRQGLLPITKHVDVTHMAAEAALEGLRKESGSDMKEIAEIVQALAKSAELEISGDHPNAISVLAAVRAATTTGKRLEPDLLKKLSLAETAAVLAETDRRGQKLAQSIEQVLGAIAAAHKETCVCAF